MFHAKDHFFSGLLMDSTSPAHENFQVWNSIWSHPGEAYEHAGRESMDVFNSDVGKYQNKAERLIQHLYDIAK